MLASTDVAWWLSMSITFVVWSLQAGLPPPHLEAGWGTHSLPDWVYFIFSPGWVDFILTRLGSWPQKLPVATMPPLPPIYGHHHHYPRHHHHHHLVIIIIAVIVVIICPINRSLGCLIFMLLTGGVEPFWRPGRPVVTTQRKARCLHCQCHMVSYLSMSNTTWYQNRHLQSQCHLVS